MTRRPLQHRIAGATHPFWTRWIAVACLFLAGVVGTVQAVHVHGDWLPDNAAQLHAPADDGQQLGGEEHCPLCVAMHSAMPVAPHALTVEALLSKTRVIELSSVAPATQWHFAMFSRPPPAAI